MCKVLIFTLVALKRQLEGIFLVEMTFIILFAVLLKGFEKYFKESENFFPRVIIECSMFFVVFISNFPTF